jgi:hypothetical protein
VVTDGAVGHAPVVDTDVAADVMEGENAFLGPTSLGLVHSLEKPVDPLVAAKRNSSNSAKFPLAMTVKSLASILWLIRVAELGF